MGHASPPDYEFAFFPAPEDLRGDTLSTFYHLRSDAEELNDGMPITGGQFVHFLSGSGEMILADGKLFAPGATFFITPLTQAAKIRLKGPVHVVGVALTSLGWAELTGLDADKFGDQVLPAEPVLGDVGMADMAELHRIFREGAIDAEQVTRAMGEILRPRFQPLPDAQRSQVKAVLDWLHASASPKVDDLYDLIPLSRRQVQRICRRFFGLPPVSLTRRIRATNFAAALVHNESGGHEVEEALEDSFFDQSHMIRTVREFAGRTPSKLGKPQRSVLADALHPSGYRRDGKGPAAD